MFTIKFNDGSTLDGLTLNGDYFMTSQPVDAKYFSGKLYNVTIAGKEFDEENEHSVTYPVMKLHEVRDFGDGNYGFILSELSREDRILAAIDAKIAYLAMMTDNNI